jgi:hypothetical protein
MRELRMSGDLQVQLVHTVGISSTVRRGSRLPRLLAEELAPDRLQLRPYSIANAVIVSSPIQRLSLNIPPWISRLFPKLEINRRY